MRLAPWTARCRQALGSSSSHDAASQTVSFSPTFTPSRNQSSVQANAAMRARRSLPPVWRLTIVKAEPTFPSASWKALSKMTRPPLHGATENDGYQ